MPFGKGKYADLTKELLIKTEAETIILLIVNGNKGNGFSVASRSPNLSVIPTVLREVAQQIEAETKEISNADNN